MIRVGAEMAGVYLSSLAVVAASVIVGAAIMRACGSARPMLIGAAVGNAALIVLASLAIRLPGAYVTALVALGATILLAAVLARHERPSPVLALEGLLLVFVMLALLSLPFLVAGHFGPLGVSLDDDLGFHVAFVELLHAGHPIHGLAPSDYPTGLESLAAVFGGTLRGADRALVGSAAAAPVLTGLVALGALRRAPFGLRVLGAAAVGLPYLSAAYFGESSFKEVEMALLVLAFMLLSAPARARPDESAPAHAPPPVPTPRLRRLVGVIPLVLLAMAMYLVLSTAGLVYPIAIVAARAAVAGLERARGKTMSRLGGGRAFVAVVVLACGLVAAALYLLHHHSGLLPNAVGKPKHPGGNFVRELPPTEGFGVWLARDFRLAADTTPLAPLLVGLALTAWAAGAMSMVRERDWTLLAPAIAVLVVVVVARGTVNAYDSAKAMVIVGPLLLLIAIAPLANLASERKTPGWRVIGPVAAAGLAAAVLWTGAYVLRSDPVDSDAFDVQLAAMAPFVAHDAVLFLGRDDWVIADLPESHLQAPIPYAVAPPPLRPRAQKGVTPPFDFDTEPPAGLDSVHFVITTRTLDASGAPANFRPLRVSADFILWVRRGPSPPRDVLDEGSQPGAVLDCRRPAMARLASRRGEAAIRAAPVVAPAWRDPDGEPEPLNATYAFTGAGESASTTLSLPPGRWQLSLDYESAGQLRLRIEGRTITLPSRLEPVGQLTAVADIQTVGGPLPVELGPGRSPAPAVFPGALTHPLVAVPTDEHDRLVPLHAACGHYVDWYRLDG